MSKSYDPLFDPDFVGYNCRDPELEGDFGIIENISDYAEEYYPSIIESLPDAIKEKATRANLCVTPKKADESFKQWSSQACEFFKKNGIRWIFVREEVPENDFDSQFYYVSFPEEKILCSFDYLFDDEEIRIIVYATKGDEKCRPKMIAVPDDFSDDIEDEESDDLDDPEENEDRGEGEAYWEGAWKGTND